jgi:hypothetical protein
MGTLRRECLDHVLIIGEEPPQRRPGHAVDITARIERSRFWAA